MRTSAPSREPPDPAPGRTRTVPGRWLIARWTAEALLSIGLLVLCFVAYQFFVVPLRVTHQQHALDTRLQLSWQDGAPGGSAGAQQPPAEGDPFVRLSLPRLGMSWVVVEGVSRSALSAGPGHYPGTALPGQIGDFAVAGHRSRRIFLDLDRIQPGDTAVVETRDAWFVYRVYQTEIVLPTDLAVIAPQPDQPDSAPSQAILTLTTCDPKWGNSHRLVVHALLAMVRPKHGGGALSVFPSDYQSPK
jgi:sortase A